MMNLSKKLNKEYLLKESKCFCMAPWIHMHMWPNGETFPCCITPANENNKGMGNFNNTTVKELWNCDTMKKLRSNMLNEKPSKECTRCYELEESGNVWTLRKDLNGRFSEKFYRVEQTHTDGSHDDPQFYYWDIRFNNLCNMKCRTCGPEFSTSWWQDYPHLKNNKNSLIALTNKPTFWEEIRPFVDNIESVYFAGGEPLITDEHYTMLDIWLEQKKNDIHISYTTNFSRLKHKGKNVLEYWRQFNNVDVVASLDGSYKRGEWIRKGTRWSKIVANRNEMKEMLPNTMFGITPTVSVFNVW
ncbi:MAG: twitch domain-containing radical SAM protein, partial [SAR202 cluster bacterium]|nr:twitch domain-containing radical SAM protein [SAR202 cluster bacterium]